MFSGGWAGVEIAPDLAGIPRVIAAQWVGGPGFVS
jgi:hypothetical protein